MLDKHQIYFCYRLHFILVYAKINVLKILFYMVNKIVEII